MKTTKQERIVLAALFGGTNMGMALPTRDQVQKLLDGYSLQEAVYALWSRYMDDDAMEKAFLQEARSWLKEPSFKTHEEVLRIWPHNAELVF